jgi:hypothetical protein
MRRPGTRASANTSGTNLILVKWTDDEVADLKIRTE